MQLENEIVRAISHLSATDPDTAMTKEELACLTSNVLENVKNRSYHFENTSIIILSQHSKKRLVKLYPERYSSENILCQCLKQLLDKDFKVKYPNRNKISRALFSTLSATIQMADFTIVRFDFKNYFNSISAEYAFNKYIEYKISDRLTREILSDFCRKTKFTFAGLPTSNAIAEIVATEFDSTLKKAFNSLGIVFYERYIDDSVLILNQHVNEYTIKKMLDSILDVVFCDKAVSVSKRCSTKYNASKYSYITKRTLTGTPVSFDFLGYEFWLHLSSKRKTIIQYGITQDKRMKYRKRLEQMIKQYTDPCSTDYQNCELLRHRIMAFSSREVYLSVKKQSYIWKAKGFISNYGELRYLLGTDLLHADTDHYLKNVIKDSFSQAGVIPYFISDADKIDSGYNLFHNMKVNKTLLLVDGIGYDYKSLTALCAKVGINNIDANGNKRTYNSLVREYLIRVRVGF
jgi:hypothetical protein